MEFVATLKHEEISYLKCGSFVSLEKWEGLSSWVCFHVLGWVITVPSRKGVKSLAHVTTTKPDSPVRGAGEAAAGTAASPFRVRQCRRLFQPLAFPRPLRSFLWFILAHPVCACMCLPIGFGPAAKYTLDHDRPHLK